MFTYHKFTVVMLSLFISLFALTNFSNFWMFWSFISFFFMMVMQSSFCFNESFTVLLTILCCWSFILTLPAQESFFMEFNSKLLLIISLIFFCTTSNLIFYVMFEMSLIPITLIIMSYGLNNERIMASFYLFAYTTVVSLPLLSMLVSNDLLSNFNNNSILSPIQNLFLMTAFLVKLPCWFFHTWLTKAHVESPTAGSIILAAVLLKMGSYGLLRLSSCLIFSYWLILSVSLGGFLMAAFMSSIQSDIKKLIAYSSISHMSYSLFCLCLLFNSSSFSFLMIIMSHGVSSGLFFQTMGCLSHSSKTRNMLLVSSSNKMNHETKFVFLTTLFTNMATPLTIQFYPEVFTMMMVMNLNIFGFFSASLMMFIVCYFSMYVLLVTNSQSQSSNLFKTTFFLNNVQNLNFCLLLWVYCSYLSILNPVYFLYYNNSDLVYLERLFSK